MIHGVSVCYCVPLSLSLSLELLFGHCSLKARVFLHVCTISVNDHRPHLPITRTHTAIKKHRTNVAVYKCSVGMDNDQVCCWVHSSHSCGQCSRRERPTKDDYDGHNDNIRGRIYKPQLWKHNDNTGSDDDDNIYNTHSDQSIVTKVLVV